jgi:hypothetical protein
VFAFEAEHLWSCFSIVLPDPTIVFEDKGIGPFRSVCKMKAGKGDVLVRD